MFGRRNAVTIKPNVYADPFMYEDFPVANAFQNALDKKFAQSLQAGLTDVFTATGDAVLWTSRFFRFKLKYKVLEKFLKLLLWIALDLTLHPLLFSTLFLTRKQLQVERNDAIALSWLDYIFYRNLPISRHFILKLFSLLLLLPIFFLIKVCTAIWNFCYHTFSQCFNKPLPLEILAVVHSVVLMTVKINHLPIFFKAPLVFLRHYYPFAKISLFEAKFLWMFFLAFFIGQIGYRISQFIINNDGKFIPEGRIESEDVASLGYLYGLQYYVPLFTLILWGPILYAAEHVALHFSKGLLQIFIGKGAGFLVSSNAYLLLTGILAAGITEFIQKKYVDKRAFALFSDRDDLRVGDSFGLGAAFQGKTPSMAYNPPGGGRYAATASLGMRFTGFQE
jgi:hypothetical protein